MLILASPLRLPLSRLLLPSVAVGLAIGVSVETCANKLPVSTVTQIQRRNNLFIECLVIGCSKPPIWIQRFLGFRRQLKGCVARSAGHYCPSQTAGVAQLVEHHLAKVDVASSSLVTRSSLRLERSANRGLERARRSLGEGGPPKRSRLRLAGQPCDVLRLLVEVPLSPNTTVCRFDLRSATAASTT